MSENKSLLLVIDSDDDQQSCTNRITTPGEFDQFSNAPEFIGGLTGKNQFSTCPASLSTHEEVMLVSLDDPAEAVHKAAEFLRGAWNQHHNACWNNAPEYTSPGARALLPSFMQPILDADIGRGKHHHPMEAIEWAKKHADFVDDLNTVYSDLGILRVDRIRASVTQGEVSVKCNGYEAIRYGDEMCLQGKDGTIKNPWRDKSEIGQLYGPIIDGWGSASPDDSFCKAALTQCGEEIYECLQRTPLREVEIWQLDDSSRGREALFLNYDRMERLAGGFDPSLYRQVWQGELEAKDLGDIFYIFNMDHPEDFKGHSLSVSDVVRMDGQHYFCDSYGWKAVPFKREKPFLEDRLKEAKAVTGKQNDENDKSLKTNMER